MSMDKMIPLMLGGIKDTLYMTTVSTLFAYLLGLPIAILLVLTAPSGLKPQKLVYRLLDTVVNIFRSIPFLILMILVIPVTRAIAGKAYGSTATIVPLVIAAAPYVARMIESSLLEVDPGVIEAAQVPRTLADVDLGVINSNYALQAGTDVVGTPIAYESTEVAYPNIIAVREGDDREELKTLVEVLQGDEIVNFINETYKGAVVPTK